MTDDHFSTRFSSIDNKINGISVGGTNLLLNTKDFTGDWYQQGSANLRDLDGRKVIHAWADWSSYITRQVIQLEQNTDYTISADIRSLEGNSSDNTVVIRATLDGKDTQLGDLHTNGKLSSKQQRFSAVWHNTSAGQLTKFRLESHGGWSSVNGSIYISHIKLEKGNKPTDWSPAPEDTDSNISALESRASKLEQTDSEIKASVTSLTSDLKNGRGSIKEGLMSMTDDHFSTRFSSIDNRLNNIGGTNYITAQLIRPSHSNLSYDSNTGIWTAVIGNGSGGIFGGGIGFNKSKMEVPWGQPYTDSVEVYVTDKGLTWSYDINNNGVVNDSNLGGNDNDERSLSTQSPSNTTEIPTNQWYKLTFTAWNKNSKNKNHTALYDDSTMGIVNNTGKSITVKFRHPKQELGSVATDWSPADVQSQIDSVVSKQAEFKTSIDGVKSTVSTLNNNQAKFTKFEQTDGGFKLFAGQKTLEFGGENLIPNSGNQQGQDTSHWYYGGPAGSGGGIDIEPHGIFYNGTRGILKLWNTTAQEAYVGTEYVNVEPNTEYTLSFDIFGNTEVKNYDVFVLGDGGNLNKKVHDFDGGSIIKLVDAVHQSPSHSERIVKTFRTNGKDKRVYVRFDNNGVTKTNSYKYGIWIGDVKLEKGNTATAWSPSGTELVDKTTNLQKGLSTAQATIEQNSKSIALKVSKGDVINQINLDTNGVKINGDKISITAGNAKSIASQINVTNNGIKLSGEHIAIDGNTTISGQLKIGAVPLVNGDRKLSLDLNGGIFIGDSKNTVSINNGAVGIAYNDGAAAAVFTGFGVEFGANTNGREEVLGALGVTYLGNDTNINGLGIIIESQQILGDPYGGDIFTISARNSNGTIRNDMIYDAIGGSGIKGFTFYENVRVYPPGAATGITTGWIQYGNGAKWPVLMNTPPNYGGIGFTTDGNPFLFSNKHGYMFTDGSRGGDVYSNWSP